MNATAIRDKNVFDATVNAVIIYDKFDSAAEANAMLERAAHRTDEADWPCHALPRRSSHLSASVMN
jgi:hypothetical protein